MKRTQTQRKWGSMKVLAAGITAAAFAFPVYADTELEWDPTEGYHEEEWYDPSDWFSDDGQIDYEDTYTYDTDYWGGDYYDTFDNDYLGYDYYDYEPYYADNYADADWDDEWYDSYDYDDSDYGYHAVWDAAEQQWETEYGWETGAYDVVYTPDTTSQQNQQRQQAQRGQQDRQNQQAQRGQDRQNQQAQRGQQDRQNQQAQRDRQNQQGQQAQRRQQNQQAQKGQQGMALTRTTVTGTIEGFQKMKLREGDKKSSPVEQTLAKVDLQNGDTYVVAMGDKKITDELKPKSGDEIEVTGVRAMIKGMPAIVANELTIGDKTVNIERKAAQRIAFSGTVAGFGKAKMDGKDNHLLVNLKFAGKKEGGIVVDFGPDTTMKDLKLKKGSKITVVGEKGQVGDKAVLIARQYNVMQKKQSGEEQASASTSS